MTWRHQRFHTGGVTRTRAVAAAALLPLAGLVGLVFNALTDDELDKHVLLYAAVVVAVISPGVVGLLIVRREPRNVIGWLLAAHALFIGAVLTGGSDGSSTSETGRAFEQVTMGSWILLYICLVFVAYLFPNGHFHSRAWRRWGMFCLAGYACFMVGAAWDRSGFQELYPGQEPPLWIPPELVAGLVGFGGLIVIAASLVGTVVAARARLKGATGDERLQLLWFTWAALAIPTMLAMCWVDFMLTDEAGYITVLSIALLGSAIPVVVGIAILRYRLFDIEVVLSRTLTYGALTVGVMGTYALVLALANRFFDNTSVGGLLGVGLVAVAVQPAHALFRRRAERWVYGDRSDPTSALRRLSDRVEQTAGSRRRRWDVPAGSFAVN